MLLFIDIEQLERVILQHFKTSYVIVYPHTASGSVIGNVNFKTSYVIVYRISWVGLNYNNRLNDASYSPCRSFQGTQAGFEAQKERPPSLRR